MTISVHRVRAFSRDVAGGNLAGVVLNSDGLSASEMTEIAGRVEASETAFLTPLDRGMARIRWFSAASEVGFCIHATIAAVGVLRDLELVNTRAVTLESPIHVGGRYVVCGRQRVKLRKCV